MLSATLSVLRARLREFYRDKASLSWGFVFPFFIIIALYFSFSKEEQKTFFVGVVSSEKIEEIKHPFLQTKYIHFKKNTLKEGVEKIKKHELDLLIEPTNEKVQYWVNSSSQKGYFLEKALVAESPVPVLRAQVEGKEIQYIDWVFPGVIAMNLMFSCLWGVGYAIVKYRQDGYLKRLKATPLTAFQFLLGQIGARYVISSFVTTILIIGGQKIIGFEMQGSYLDLAALISAGVFALLSVGLLVATRTTSKELADGILNLASWPMMFISGVWFSLEGASTGMKWFSELLPLTHLVSGMRAIMTEGATLSEVTPQLLTLLLMGGVLLALSAFLFKWSED